MASILKRWVPLSVMLAGLTFINRELMEKCFIGTAYYLMGLLVLTWVVVLCNFLRHHGAETVSLLHESRVGLVVALILVVVIFVSVPPKLRVLYDEVNLLDVSRSMTYEKKPVILNEGAVYYDVMHPIYSYVDKRPLLCPYLTSLLHTLFGYRLANVYILNFVALLVLLWLVYIALRQSIGNLASIACLVLIVSHPIVTLTATSGIFDLFAASFLAICLVSTWGLIKNPSVYSFHLLWVSLLMMSNIRYESLLYAGIVIVMICAFRRVKREYFANLWPCAITALLLLPLFWQRLLKNVDPQLPGGENMFSFSHFVNNNLLFLKGLLRFDFHLPYATVVLWAGLLCLAWFAYRIFRSSEFQKNRDFRHWLMTSFAVLTAAWIVVTGYYWSGFDNIVSCRFYIPFCIVLSIVVAVCLGATATVRRRPVILLLGSLVVFSLYHPVAIENRMLKERRGFIRNYTMVSNYLKDVTDKNVLLIGTHPRQYIVHGFGAIRVVRANREKGIHLHRYRHKLYKDIYVVQEVDFKTNRPIKGQQLADEYKLQPVYEQQNRSGRFLLISKVVNKR